MSKAPIQNATVTTNACKGCEPLGACLAFRGIEGTVPLLHGSQGCATYIRRYLIGHFREPMDVASSSFDEESAIFGGGANLKSAIDNVIAAYRPKAIGIASSCLSETIGDDLAMLVKGYRPADEAQDPPELFTASTPSYRGSHIDGFHAAARAVTETLTGSSSRCGAGRPPMLNCYPGLVSPADLRHLKEILAGFGVEACLLPDYSETLDRPILAEYETTPPGGAPLERIRRTPSAIATLSLGATTHAAQRGGALLSERFGVPERVLGLPIGVAETDRFVAVLEEVTGNPAPAWLAEERGRLIDAYVDAHKYVFGKRAAVYGGEDFVVGVASFLGEIGVTPVICASGGKSGRLREAIGRVCPEHADQIRVLDGVDFADIEEEARGAQLHLVVGNSKGYALARRLDLPLMRLGFPIHDRVGGQRLLHVGYRGAQQVFDFVVNRLIAAKQDSSPVGYLNM